MGDDNSGVGRLTGLRVLVAEDSGLIASKISRALRAAGCIVIGPVATVTAGLGVARQDGNPPDAAVLDIDLRGKEVYPLAQALRLRQVPFMFLTGFGALLVPEPWHDVVRLEKPFDQASLLAALASALTPNTAVLPVGSRPTPGAPSQVVRQAWEVIRRSRNLAMEGQIRREASSRGRG